MPDATSLAHLDLTDADRRRIAASLEVVAARCPDPTAMVYARLFEIRPELEALFVRDVNGAVKGEMLAKVFEIVLDLVGDGRFGANMVRCEVVTNDGYGVPPDDFPLFFDVVAQTVVSVLADDRDPEDDLAWRRLLATLRALTGERRT
jgi:hemoglobin-like flavoprotein